MTFSPSSDPVDVLVVGAGITGIYQLHRALRGGLLGRSCSRPATASAAPGSGTATPAPGSTPRATPTATSSRRSSSTSGSGRSTSPASPRSSATSTTWSTGSTCGATCASAPAVTSAVCDEPSGTWAVTTDDGDHDPGPLPRRRHRRAVGALPARRPRARRLPGRAAPHRPVAGRAGRLRRQAGGGGRHLVERRAGGRRPIVDEVASLTVYQRTANWCTPLNNRPITAEEQARAAGRLRAAARGAEHLDPRVPPPAERRAAPSTTRPRSGWRSSRRCGPAPGFMKFTSNYVDILMNPEANAEWCEFIAGKIRGIVRRPRHRRAADPEGPPLRREAPALRRRLLRGVQPAPRVARRPARHADRARHRDRHRDHRRRAASSTSSCGPPASTSAPAP